ncbi:hypothetical protein SAMN05216238_10810 [Lentibacillus persicus]|uniref:Uncharacterized protein n=1 Tax=Lentibacillus persicus TaxID=640948 RepID=A0A1I1XQ97_9BACI|nr:hypothetical protein [Lentibacillus persicus]SFE07730.1 hypothetical protein SAMN05216238_10810 [Lentibacillus persicus]
MPKRMLSTVVCVGLLFLGCMLMFGNANNLESQTKTEHSAHHKLSQYSSKADEKKQQKAKKPFVTPEYPVQKFICISPGETAPPEAANAYITEKDGPQPKAKPLPNADPDKAIVIMQLPNHPSTK